MPHATSPEGRLLGGFQILREIGRGGMGVVYEAVDAAGRRVALKVLEAHLTLQRSAVDRFLREAHAAAALRHDHIVPVTGVGEEEGVHYFAMELVDGASLAEVIAALAARARGEPATLRDPQLVDRFSTRPFAAAARIIAAIARALHHAHEHGVLHRDVKPSNLLLRRDGRPLLIDFGLAREEGLPALTQTGDLVGSPYYVAPEQCGGGHIALDRRVDVYSLGVVLYELLTLQRPFEGTSAREVLDKIEGGETLPPRQLRPDLPKVLDAIVRRAMALRPDDRYATAADLARDLERFVRGRPTRARVGEWHRAVASAWRSKPTRVAVVCAAVFVVALAAGRRFGALDPVAWARSTARLTIESEPAGAIAELFDGELAVGPPSHRVTLPQLEPLRLKPGRHALRVRAAGHDACRLEGARALDLAADEQRVARVWLAPLFVRWTRELAPVAAPPAAADVDGDDRSELIVAEEGGRILAVDGEGAVRPFADLAAEPYRIAAAHGPSGRGARLAVAASRGLLGFVRGFEADGTVAFERTIPGRVTALIAVEAAGGSVHWLVATDLGSVDDLDAAAGAATGAPSLGNLGSAIYALATGPGLWPRVAALTRATLLLLEPGKAPVAVAGGGGPFSENASLALLNGRESTLLAAIDVSGVRCFALDAEGGGSLRWERSLALRHASVVSGASGDRLAFTSDDGRLRLLDRDGNETASIEVGESEALAVVRSAGGEPTIVVATTRGLVGCTTDGAQRFELPTVGRVAALAAADLDGDGVEDLAVRYGGDRFELLASEGDVRWKALSDVIRFAVVPEGVLGAARLLAEEKGGTIVALAADGRRLAQLKAGRATTALSIDVEARCVWLGSEDGGLRALSWDAGGLRSASADRPSPNAITALALGRLGADASPRLVTGDAGGGIDVRRSTGSGESRFTPRKGASVRQLVVGDLGGDGRDEAVVVLAGGVLLRFDPGALPRPPIELGRECTALALADVDGDGAKEILVALEGGELRVVGNDGSSRGTVALPAAATAIVDLSSEAGEHAVALVGLADGGLLLIESLSAPPRLLTILKGPVVEIAAAPRRGIERFAATSADGVVVVDRDGRRLAEAPSRGGAGTLALADLEEDGERELVHIDDQGRLVVREIARAPRR